MLYNIICGMLEVALVYFLTGWFLHFAVLLSQPNTAPPATLAHKAKQAAITAITHPFNLAIAIYHLAVRVIVSSRK